MDVVGSLLLSPWLSREDLQKVRDHTKENFTYVRYFDLSKPLMQNGQTTHEERAGRLNKVTREIMWGDPPPVVGFKQFLLIACHIPYTLGHLLNHPIKCAYHIIENFSSLQFQKGFTEIAYRAWRMVRTAYYMTGMAVALILGILIDPIKAREAYGLLDFHHNDDIEYSASFTRLAKKKVPCWEAAQATEAYYFAKCMQPWIRNFDESLASPTGVVRRYQLVQQSDKIEEIDWGKDEKGQPKKQVDCDWAIYPILPCLRMC